MLVLGRRQGQSLKFFVKIGDEEVEFSLTICKLNGSAKIGIEAPPCVTVVRSELEKTS
jgi:sRNA-binding carbon storage regulator CsrA